MKQTDLEKIHRTVVATLARNWKTKPTDEEISDMLRHLGQFDETVLTEAMDGLIATSKTAPRIAHIAEACRRLAPKPTLSAEDAGEFLKAVWKRVEAARKDALDCRARFEGTDLAVEAREGGWLDRLLAYVHEAAWFQAQLIARIPNPGYGCMPFWSPDLRDMERRTAEFVEDCKRQAVAGFINVVVPGSLLDQWRQRGAA